jgi:SAM-dependent methyltransferase
VVLIHVIEHVHDPAAVLARLHRVLRPGGRLFLALPNAESWAAAVFGRHFCWEVPRHLQFFTPRTLRRLLRRQSFEVEGMQWGYLPIQWVRGISYVLGGPRNWAGRVFAAHNPLWLALTGPFEWLAAACGAATRMTLHARKPVRVDGRPEALQPSPESPAGATPARRRSG